MGADVYIDAIVEITEENQEKIKLYNQMIKDYEVPEKLKKEIIEEMPFLKEDVEDGNIINNIDGHVQYDEKEYDEALVNVELYSHPSLTGDIESNGAIIDLDKLPPNTKKIKVYMMA